MATDERDTELKELGEKHFPSDYLITNGYRDERLLIALREAYDKGHDARAREQREKHSKLAANWLGTPWALSEAIRAGRE